MIDISHKRTSLRYARASGSLKAAPEIIEKVRNNQIPKGNVAEVARSAGIQAGKRASEWIVFCHTMPVDWVEVSMDIKTEYIEFTSEVRSVWKTGMEMEAMAAASAALLNAYDMLKPLQADIEITGIRLLEKTGGKSDVADTFDAPLKAGLIVVSNAKKEGRREDNAGKEIQAFLQDHPVELEIHEYLEEDSHLLEKRLISLCDEEQVDLIFTCGATGPAPRDITSEVIKQVSDKVIPGIGEAMRHYGYQRTPFSMLSDQVGGVRNQSLIIAIPGSSQGAKESLNALFPGVLHAIRMLHGK